MQNALNKFFENENAKVLVFVLFFVVGLKLFAPMFGEMAKYFWITAAALTGAAMTKHDDKWAWPIAVYVAVAMLPMGYIEFNKALIVLIALMTASIFLIRAMMKNGPLPGFASAVVLGFGLAFFVTKILEGIPTSTTGLTFGF